MFFGSSNRCNYRDCMRNRAGGPLAVRWHSGEIWPSEAVPVSPSWSQPIMTVLNHVANQYDSNPCHLAFNESFTYRHLNYIIQLEQIRVVHTGPKKQYLPTRTLKMIPSRNRFIIANKSHQFLASELPELGFNTLSEKLCIWNSDIIMILIIYQNLGVQKHIIIICCIANRNFTLVAAPTKRYQCTRCARVQNKNRITRLLLNKVRFIVESNKLCDNFSNSLWGRYNRGRSNENKKPQSTSPMVLLINGGFSGINGQGRPTIEGCKRLYHALWFHPLSQSSGMQ